ncbi:MAG: hypothetical protein JXQ83_05530 [Candidatus Glassbacteria bacterium]|nr:hypothetical protein [Candidatus Glassbacteria bacterium]
MSGFSRRQVFGSFCAGALGLAAFGRGRASAGPLHRPAADLSALAGRKNKTRIYRLFLAKPRGLEGWPYHEYDHAARAEFFKKRLNRIGDVEWVGDKLVESDEDFSSVAGSLGEVDGVVAVVLTSPARGIMRLGELKQPVLLYNDLFCGDCSFLGPQKILADQGVKLVSLSTADVGLLESRIQLLRTVGRLRRSKIICFRDRSPIGKELSEPVADKLGIELAQMGSAELVQGFEQADRAAAKKIAEGWVGTARKVVEPKFEEIVDSARMYLGIRSIMEREKANAVTIDCLGMVYGRTIPAYPCLAFVQLNDDGYVGACESDMAATLTMLIVGFLADRPGFISDPVLDTEAGVIYHAHCLSATRMSGFDRVAEPCIIRSHSEDRSGVSLEVLFSPGNTITAAKYVPCEKMLVSTGVITGNKSTELACRTKMVTRVEGVRNMLDGYSGGLHRIIFYGDHLQDLRDLGRLLGFSVVEETKA